MKVNKKPAKLGSDKNKESKEENVGAKVKTQVKKLTKPLLIYFSKTYNKQALLPQFNYFKSIQKTLYQQYSSTITEYDNNQIDNLLDNKNTHTVAIFKDYMIMDYVDEYLKRTYNTKEAVERIPKFVNYYKNYLLFFCKPTFRDFDINDIMQLYGERSAELYYNRNYVHNKTKNKTMANDAKDNLFSSTIRAKINNRSVTNQSIYDKHINKNNENDTKTMNEEMTLELSKIDTKRFKMQMNHKEDDDSMVSIVNLIKNNKDIKNFDLYKNSMTDANYQTERIPWKENKAIKKEKQIKCLSPNQGHNELSQKFKNKHRKNGLSIQFKSSVPYLNTETTPILSKTKKEIKTKTSIKSSSELRSYNTRNTFSTLPLTSTYDLNKMTMQMCTTNYLKKNTNVLISNQIKNFPLAGNSRTNKENDGKKMNTHHTKNQKSMNKLPSQSRNKIQLSHGMNMPSIQSPSPVYSTFNNFDRQQQMLNINKKGINNGFTVSSSKGGNSVTKKKNSRFNSDPFQTDKEKQPIKTGKIMLGIADKKIITNTNGPLEVLMRLKKRKTLGTEWK